MDAPSNSGREKIKRLRKASKQGPMSVTRAYIQRICRKDLLSKEEEIDLATKAHDVNENVKEGASKQLVEANLRLVVKIAHEFKQYGLPLRDLISAGSLGLIHAVEKFDPERGARFATYAVWWIKQSIRRALDSQNSTIRIPVQSASKLKKIKSAYKELRRRYDRDPTDAEIAKHLDLTEQSVSNLKHADLSFHSLYEQIQHGDDSGEFQDIIADKNAVMPDEMLGDVDSIKQLRRQLKKLSEREQSVIIKRFGLDGEDPQTLEEVARENHITRERVRQIQHKAFQKIRKMMKH